MKPYLLLLLLLVSLSSVQAQDTTLVLNTRMFTSDNRINLSGQKRWDYHTGNNPAWASPDLSTKAWVKRQPTDLSVNDADASGRVEGWFRIAIQLDSSFRGMPVWLKKSTWAAADLYVDGQLVASYGNTGADGKPYQEHNPWNKPPIPVKLAPEQVHMIAIHVVDYVAPLRPGKLKSNVYPSLSQLLQLTGPQFQAHFVDAFRINPILTTLWWVVSLMVALFLWLLASQRIESQSMFRLLAIQTSFASVYGMGYFLLIGGILSFQTEVIVFQAANSCMSTSTMFLPIVLLHLVRHPLARRITAPLLIAVGLTALLTSLTGGLYVLSFVIDLASLLLLFYALIVAWKWVSGAQWVIVGGCLLTFVCILSIDYFLFTIPDAVLNVSNPTTQFIMTAGLLCTPLSFLLYVALRFREILVEIRDKSAAVLQITQEKNDLLATENDRLEQQVETRTAELKASQAQLIQKEKLASLGELTAGIAHEIQNPLNFVNNFSEVSRELIDELKEALAKGDLEEAQLIADDLTSNLQKINHHGGRASTIVKGMLEHSRSESGEKRSIDLNALADEYLKIAYHGLRAKDKTGFNCELVTHFDPSLEPLKVIPQDIGRVLLNLYNNAFYAVSERHKRQYADYQPTVSVSTKQLDDHIEIRVWDNGTGIPESVKAKIFQPFFTTKPTGEGTGLGLSLSYDIVTKGHGGTLTVESQPGEGTEFAITLPIT